MSNELEKFIRSNPDALDRKKPDAALLSRILLDMESKKKEERAGKVISFRWAKWAAACLIVAACGIAWWYFNQPKPPVEVTQTNIPEKPSLPTPAPTTDLVEHTTVDPVEEKAVTHKRTVVPADKKEKAVALAGLNNMQSTASRIDAVTSVSRMKNNGHEVVKVLVQTLNNDPNTNVRLAALDGLTRFHKKAYVRKELVASLKKQQDPLVQIDLIDLLIRIQELSIVSELENMINDENTNKAVRDVAWSGMQQLRHLIIN